MRSFRTLMLTAVVMALFAMTSAQAQDNEKVAIVSLYHVAPGKHMDFLKWMQQQEAVAREAGVGATQWYAHLDGDNWDYLAIGPMTTDEQDKKVEEIAKKKGLATGMKASLQFRTVMMDHTDTLSWGPVSIDEMVKAGSE